MRLPRFRLQTLMGVVVGFAIALGALRESTALWAELIETSTLVILAAAALRAIALRGISRIYWAGFLIAGLTYLVATWDPAGAARIITDRGLDVLGRATGWSNFRYIIIGAQSIDPEGNWAYPDPNAPPGRSDRLPWNRPDPVEFYRIGHSLLVLTCASLGGWYARQLWIANAGKARLRGGAEV